MQRAWIWPPFLLATALVVWGAWFGRFPLGVPGEWQWVRLPAPAATVATLTSAALVAVAYLGFVALGAMRMRRAGKAESAGWLAGLCLAGFAWLWTAQELAPTGYQLSKAAWVLYYPKSSGYFTEARYDGQPLEAFLSGYERKMATGDVLHQGTHPPGLILFFRGLIEAFHRSPIFVEGALALEPESVRASFQEIQAVQVGTAAPMTTSDRAVLWIAALIANGLGAATVVPLYWLLRLTSSPRASWLAVSFWPAVPALAVFLPKSDAVFPFLASLILFLWVSGAARRSVWRCALAGTALWIGMMLSLAFIPVAVIAAGVTAYDAVLRRRISGPACSESSAGGVAAQRRFGVAACAAGAAAGFLLPTILVWAAAGLNMSAVWLLNFRNHAGFYAQFPRTWWKWLLVNPVEFAVAAGAPLAVLTIWSLVRQWKTLRWEVAGQFCVVPATWLLLLVSGKNMGEAARLWIFMMPCLIWLAAPLFESKPDARGDAPTGLASRGAWAVSLALQLLVSTVLVLRMGGFHYDETADPTQAEHPAKAFAPPRLASSANPVLPAKAAALSAVDLRSR